MLVPKILINTQRLQMRKFCVQDAKEVLEFNSNERVLEFIPGEDKINSIEEAVNVIENIWLKEYEKFGYARYALIHKTDNKIIGFCGFKYEPKFAFPDIGYRISPEYWNQGFVSEAIETLLKYGKDTLGLKKVVAAAAVDNIGSNKILLKFGFFQKRMFVENGMPHYYYENWH